MIGVEPPGPMLNTLLFLNYLYTYAPAAPGPRNTRSESLYYIHAIYCTANLPFKTFVAPTEACTRSDIYLHRSLHQDYYQGQQSESQLALTCLQVLPSSVMSGILLTLLHFAIELCLSLG